jgi:hypothetical protein
LRPVSLEDAEDQVLPFTGNILMAMSLNSDTSLKSLLPLLKQLPSIKASIANSWFVAGSSSEMINGFFSANNNSVVSTIGGHPFGIYVDAQKALQSYRYTAEEDSSLNRQVEVAKQYWKEMTVTGGEYKNGYMVFETTINMMDQSTNSLQQLAKYGAEMMSAKQSGAYVVQSKDLPLHRSEQKKALSGK